MLDGRRHVGGDGRVYRRLSRLRTHRLAVIEAVAIACIDRRRHGLAIAGVSAVEVEAALLRRRLHIALATEINRLAVRHVAVNHARVFAAIDHAAAAAEQERCEDGAQPCVFHVRNLWECW